LLDCSALDNKLKKHVMDEAVRNILAKRRRTGMEHLYTKHIDLIHRNFI
jgi:hypothetical protein